MTYNPLVEYSRYLINQKALRDGYIIDQEDWCSQKGGSWVTIKGNHVCILEGETPAEAFERQTGKKLGKPTRQKLPEKITGETTLKGWHSSPTGRLGISDPEKSTEGIGYYLALEEETARSFGRKTSPVSMKLHKPLDARGEPAYFLHERDEPFESPKPTDSVWLSACKQAITHSKTTNKNWGRNQARLNRALTDILQEQGYDGIVIENWAVKFASPSERAKRG